MGIGLERMAFCLRKRAEHEADVYFASLSLRTIVYKGMLTTGQLEDVLPRPLRRALRLSAGPGALALLDQHLPVLAAGAPLPADRAQRRDQHREGQPQLDARPRGAAAERRDPGRPLAPLPDLHPGRQRLGVLRRGPRAAAPRRPQPAARGAHDDPRGVAEPRRDGCRSPGVLRVPRHAHRAVGRAGRRRLHRRHRDRRRARPQRSAARPLTGSPTTASSCWPPRSASWTSTPERIVRKGRLQPGRMFLVDTELHRIVEDDEIKAELARTSRTTSGCTAGS